MRVVEPKSIAGYSMSIAQLWGSGPLFTVECGDCGSTFRGRVVMVSNPRLRCPFCGAVNELPLVVGGRDE